MTQRQRLTEEELTAIDQRATESLVGVHRLSALVGLNNSLARDVKRLLGFVRSEDRPEGLSATG